MAETAQASVTQQQDVNWGIFEPLHGVLGPVADIAAPLISSNMIIGFLVFLLLISWFRGPKARRAGGQVSVPFMAGPERMVAYEEMWRTEESELWDWLEERLGIAGIPYPNSNSHKSSADETDKRRRASRSKGFKAKLAEVAMNEQEVDYAIAITEEKLEALKAAVQKKKREKQVSSTADEQPNHDIEKEQSDDNP